ncbi:MAG: gamma-glutamyltransferase [Gemmatimonadetes bacterium]|nr:gamma-glutamyltransferase [Gemmatimonadota bacterium]
MVETEAATACGFPPPRLRSATLLLLAASAAACGRGSDATADFAFPPGWPFLAQAPPIVGRAAVSTTDEYASRAGLEVLKTGGNAVDAAVAVQFALAVVNPEAGNIGGGGFMVVRMADGARATLDFRETAPLAATRDMFLDEAGELTDRSMVGHLAAGVPGSVMGIWEAHKRFGTRPWAELVEPAIRMADGFVMHDRLAGSLRDAEQRLRRYESTAAIFLPDGRVPEVGARFQQPDLAATLRRIAEHGAAGFYRGRTADLIVAEMKRGGGLIMHEDLRRYTAPWRQPVVFDYRGYTVISMAPSSSGGTTLAEIANILEGYDLRGMGYHSPRTVHLLVEAAKRAFADRNAYLGDPDFVEMPLERIISDEYAAERRAGIDLAAATPSRQVGPGLGEPLVSENTTHFSIVDAAGNAVAVTTTINSGYGSLVTVGGAGFLLNNEMDDFAGKPGAPNQYGLVQGEANAVAPGKRMLSAMTPTIVLDPQGRLFLVAGSPGGPTIITTVYQILSNVIDFAMNVAAAVNAPRIHHQHLPDEVYFEKGGLTREAVAELEALGHKVVERPGYSGDVQAILVRPDGTLEAASDPRRGGKATAY